ncbi:hypothetical protein PLICRDRAFT_695029 [Plicaturopsis crispa FD-325 SS-3]|nr:hypothetical protein PLICRDRAFT_695029 [Plicaturopsis crispa FD-325 SS-3]
MPPTAVPFAMVNAFTEDWRGGNPAAIVFLSQAQELDDAALQAIARNMHQTMTTFVWLPPPSTASSEQNSATFAVRWFTVEKEVPICGHGSLAAAAALFADPQLVGEHVTAIHFAAASLEKPLSVRKAGTWLELTLPLVSIEEVTGLEREKIQGAVADAFGRDVAISYAAKGGKGFETYLMIELDPKEDLEGSEINTNAWTQTAPSTTNILTTASPDTAHAFVSRMFAPLTGIPEDHVCGSAHSLLGPYWARKLGLGEQEMSAQQPTPAAMPMRESAPGQPDPFVVYSRSLHDYTLRLWTESRRLAEEKARAKAAKREEDAKKKAQQAKASKP